MSYAGPAGIAQYSLRRKEPAGVLGRMIVEFRNANQLEMVEDFEKFGGQVIQPGDGADPEEFKGNSVFRVSDTDHYYVGPPRIERMIFVSRVFPGEVPTDVRGLVKEVDEAFVVPEGNELMIPQCYQFLHATNGGMKYGVFEGAEKYDPRELTEYGFVMIEDDQMTYFPGGDRGSSIDFTEALVRDE